MTKRIAEETPLAAAVAAKQSPSSDSAEIPVTPEPPKRPVQQPRTIVFEDAGDDLDVPDFLK